MTQTAPETTPTPQSDATHAPEPRLTGAPAAVLGTLADHPQGITTTELASAAQVGRSTAGKSLALLEKHGLAVRTPGNNKGPRRTPDLWHPAPAPTATSNDQNPDQPPATQPEPRAANATEVDPDPAARGDAPTYAPTQDSGTASPTSAEEPELPQHTSAQEDSNVSSADEPVEMSGADSPRTEAVPAPQTSPERQRTMPGTVIPSGKRKRLAPGELRTMVIDHLTAHPKEAFTATRISRVIEKSSGAIANALDKLVNQGLAEQVSDRPRTYRRTSAVATNK